MKKLSSICPLCLVVAWLPLAAGAQPETAQVRRFSLMDCLQQALEQNLTLQIERYNPQFRELEQDAAYSGWDPTFSFSGRHRYSRSGGGVDPDTQVPSPSSINDADIFDSSFRGILPWGTGYQLFGNVVDSYGTRPGGSFDNASGGVGIALTQPLLKNFWIDRTRLNIKVSKISVKQAELGLRWRIMEIVTLVENAYYDLISARERVKVQEKALQLAEQLLAENKKRVEVGTLAPLDEKQAESQVAGSRSDLLTAEQSLAQARNVLKALINDNYVEIHALEIEPTEPLTAPAQELSVQESWRKGMAQRPDLQQARLAIESQGYQVRYDRNQLFPQLDAIGGYGHSSGGSDVREYGDVFREFREGNQPNHYYGAAITFPLENRAARNAYKASKLEKERLALELRRLEQGVLTAIDNNVIAARASYQRVDSTKQARLYAEAALDAEQKKLANGKSTSFVVLQLQRDLTTAHSAEIQALADYNKALADLARGEGSTLDRRRIDLTAK